MARNPAVPVVGVRETPKTRWRTVPYTAGRGLDLGCGSERLFDTEFVVGIDNGADQQYGTPISANIQADASDLSVFAAGQWDFVFSSFLLQYFPYEKVPEVLRHWFRVVKPGGNLFLYLPDDQQYPKVGQVGSHPSQKFDVNYDCIVEAAKRSAWNWDLELYEVCDKNDEYALAFSFRKLK